MPARYDPELGAIVFDTDEEGNPVTSPVVTAETQMPQRTLEEDLVDFEDPLLTQRRSQQELLETQAQDAAISGTDDRPFISGALVSDLAKAPINAITGVGTDIVDLGLGLADVVRATAGSAGLPEQYGGMRWDQVFDDRDNPLTTLRRDTVGQMDTQAGALINQLGRLGTAAVGFKWLYKAPAVFNRVQKIGKLVQNIPGISRAYRSADVTQRLAVGANSYNRASKGRAVFTQAVKNPYLTTTFKTIADLPETAGWWKGTVNAARSLVKTKITPRNIAETLAWDLFTSFNVFGEGEDDLDETLFDFAESVGIPVWEPLLQSPLDTSVARKAKGMLDGTVVAGVGGLLVDLFRIQRFRKAFDAASPAEKKEIVRAFKDSAEELGSGIAPSAAQIGLDPFGASPSPINRLTADAPQPAAQDLLDGRVVDPWMDPAPLARTGTDVAGQLARLDDLRVRQESAALAQSQEFINRNAAIQEVDVQVDPGQPALQGGPDRPLLNPDVLEVRVRVEEPTVSPGGIRRAVEESLARGALPGEVVANVRRLMPQTRLGLIDYIQMNPPRKNEVGMLSVADQIWSDYIIGMGLEQGWARLGPDFKPVFVRSLAKEQDVSGLLTKQADALDELQRFADFEARSKAVRAESGYRDKQVTSKPAGRNPDWPGPGNKGDYQATLRAMEPMNSAGGQLDSSVQARLGEMDPVASYQLQKERVETQRAAEAERQDLRQTLGDPDLAVAQARLADPALADAQVRSVDAALNANAISEEEFARRAAEVTAEDPDQLIRQFEGVDPNDLGVEIQKLETGRGWMVYGPDGEPIKSGRFTTKRAAERAAEAERKRLRQVLAERAQQKSIDDTGEVLTLGDSDYARDGTLTGKVALTQPQINELIRYPNFRPIFDQFGVKRKTYEFTQGDMADLVDGARALLQTGEVKGPRARVLKALIDKFDTAIDKLEPAVRAQRQADSIVAETKRVLQHGDYC